MKINLAFILKTILLLLIITPFNGYAKEAPLIEQNCTSCHDASRIYDIEKSSTGWKKTVNWMRKYSKNAFSEKSAEQISQTIIDLHPNFAKKLFHIRCSKCHKLDNTMSLSLSPKQWHNLVLRERSKAITWISLDEAHDIAEHLAKTYPAKTTQKQPTAMRNMVEKKCIQCHIHKTVFKPIKTLKQWIKVNKRMQQKIPSLISDKNVLEISEYLLKVNPMAEWE